MTPRRRSNPLPMAISIAIHAGLFVELLGVGRVRLPRAAESEYKQKIEGHEQKLVWFKFRKELPSVAPAQTKHDARPPRAESIAKQQIVSSPPNAPKREQMVWTPAPELAPAPPAELPNILAVKMPEMPPKEFIPPPETPRPESSKIEMPEAPALSPVPAPQAPALEARLPPKPFTRPAIAAHEFSKPELAPEAPQLAALAPQTSAGTVAVKLPPKPFTAPPSPGRSAAAAARALEFNAPGDLNVAAVGLKPSEVASMMPVLPSPGRFSAGPKLNPNGSEGAPSGTGITVPNLFVNGPKPNARNGSPDLIAQSRLAPTSSENIRAAIRGAEPMMVTRAAGTETAHSTDAPPGAAKVSSAPDPRFDGRDIYMMAIQLPNITSNSGSWLMWYSDHALRETGHGPVSPPVARRKVDPKYIASAVAERVEGRVQLACVIDKAGRVSLIELVRGVDDRLNESAKEALQKWEFSPAMRNGIPVDVDVLVEIPFRLAPPLSHR